jgi:hypothetical protein
MLVLLLLQQDKQQEKAVQQSRKNNMGMSIYLLILFIPTLLVFYKMVQETISEIKHKKSAHRDGV